MFKKGQSGNPAGKPKGTPNAIPAKIRELCLKAAPEAITELKRLMLDKNPAIRLAAAKELLDRGIGKAAQPVVGADEGPVEVKHIISWIRDDQPEAAVSHEQLSGEIRDSWNGAEDQLPWQVQTNNCGAVPACFALAVSPHLHSMTLR